jgi:apolipoprotein N-acyltransferase
MTYCESCGNQLSDLATACPKCGHPRRIALGRIEGTAVAALVLGIFGLISCPVVLSIPALIVGNQALSKIRHDASLQGEGLARAGVILGWIGVGLGVIGVVIAVLLFAVGGSHSISVRTA